MVRSLNYEGWASLAVGKSIGFETIVAGRPVVWSWVRREPDVGRGMRRLRIWQEVDFAALNRPGGRVRAIFDIDCRDDLAPRAITILSAAGRASIRKVQNSFRVRLANGSRLTLDSGPWDLVLPDNVPALAAFYLRIFTAQGRLPFEGRTLLTGTLQTIDYRITPEGGGFKTSLGEWFVLGKNGWLASITQYPGGPEVARQIKTPPPRWHAPDAPRRKGVSSGMPARLTPVRSVPAKPADIREADVSVSFDGMTLWGRLIRPRGPLRAAAFLIGGSGAHDRFGQTGAIDLGYRDIALGLAARGVAVLQVDKPGAGRTRTDPTFLTPRFNRTIAVARAWVGRLRERAGPDTPLFLIGHSEGGQVAIVLAQDSDAVAGICLIATAYDELDRVILEQIKTDAADLGLNKEETERRLRDAGILFTSIRADRSEVELPDRLKPLAYLAPWYRDLFETAPAHLLSGLTRPVLVLHGGSDIQVSSDDARRIAEQARQSSSDVSLRVLDGLDHLMKRTLPATNIARYGDRRRRVPKAVVDSIASWILERSASRASVPP